MLVDDNSLSPQIIASRGGNYWNFRKPHEFKKNRVNLIHFGVKLIISLDLS